VEFFHILRLEFQAHTGAGEVGSHVSLNRLAKSIEEHALDPGMVMKELHVNGAGHCAAYMQVHARSAMRRERDIVRPTERGRMEKATDSTAPSAVSLQDRDGLRVEHAAEVPGSVAIFSCGDVHTQWSPASDLIQTDEIIGTYRLFKPGDTLLREAVSQVDRLRYRVCAVGVDKEFAVTANRLSGSDHALGIAMGLGANLHLHHGKAPLSPSAKLSGKLLVAVVGEAAAAVNRNRRMDLS